MIIASKKSCGHSHCTYILLQISNSSCFPRLPSALSSSTKFIGISCFLRVTACNALRILAMASRCSCACSSVCVSVCPTLQPYQVLKRCKLGSQNLSDGYHKDSGFYAQKQLLLSARLSHRNSVRPSVCHTGESVKNGAS